MNGDDQKTESKRETFSNAKMRTRSTERPTEQGEERIFWSRGLSTSNHN